MYNRMETSRPNLKYGFLALIPCVMLFMDYLIYEQRKRITVAGLEEKTIRSVFWTGAVGTAVCLLLLLSFVLLSIREKHIRHDFQYADEIVRKFFVPVNGIIGLAQQMQDAPDLTKENRQQAELIVESSRRLKLLLHDIDEYNNLKNGRITLETQSFSLKDIADASISFIMENKGNASIQLINRIPDGIAVRVNSIKMQEVMSNVLVVLLNYTPKGAITMSARSRGAYAEVIVEDDGVGVAEHAKNIIFEPIEGANNISNGHYSGTGFSLAIAKELVELHKGRMWIDKSLKDTTAVHFTLPRDDFIYRSRIEGRAEANRPRDTGARIHLPPLEKPEGNILLLKVASTHKNQMLFFLHEAGYTVDAPEADFVDLNAMSIDSRYDLIIIDEMLDYSSFSICRHIREQYGYTQLPVLLMFPNDRQANLERAYQVGANDCIDYLVMPQQLIAKVKTLVQIKKATQEALDYQLSLLQAQIQPHFLYNALNVITQLCLDDPEKAHDVLLDFSQYLRSKFGYWSASRAITVADEMKTIVSYLHVEEARFGRRLRYSIDTGGTEACLIPALMIEPLVENAVKHGISQTERGGTVTVRVDRDTERNRLDVCVQDDGCGMPRHMVDAINKGDVSQLGTGISNTMRRLKLYGGEDLSVKSELRRGTEIRFSLPLNWRKNIDGEVTGGDPGSNH